MKNLCLVVGARPNFVKAGPILRALESDDPWCTTTLLHTGQHCDGAMSASLFDDLGLRPPDINLGISGGSHAEQTGRVMVAVEKVMLNRNFDLVIVVGDVNATLAAALAAAKLNIPIAHVEAGLRSFDRRMPEETNRICTDAISTHLFTTSRDANDNLTREGIQPVRIHFVGNVMIDTLFRLRDRASQRPIVHEIGVGRNRFALLTLHRPCNVDDPRRLAFCVELIEEISRRLPVVFPIHPRTLHRLNSAGLKESIHAIKGLHILPPQGYLSFLALEDAARVVLTDSGGVQEETTALGVPCLTVRETTERPVTITHGTNRLVGFSQESVLNALDDALAGTNRFDRMPELWDGCAAPRIANVLASHLNCGAHEKGPGCERSLFAV